MSVENFRNIVDIFEHFIVEYKILTWAVFLFSMALGFLCIILWIYVYNIPVQSTLSIPQLVYKKFHSSKFRSFPDPDNLQFQSEGTTLLTVLNALTDPSWKLE